MPRTGVTAKDVADAARHLEKAGMPPTIRNIRERLGKGSLSTIAAHKRTFEAERHEGPGPALPDAIAEQLLKGAQNFWQELVDAASQEIEAVRQQTEADIAKRDQQLEEADNELSSLMDKIGAHVASIQQLEQTINDQASAIKKQNEELRAQAVELGQVNAKRDSLTEQRDTLRHELAQSNESLTNRHAECARLNERLERDAVEAAKDKTALQKHFNEYKDRLVTMSDEVREANKARRSAEKATVTAEEKAGSVKKEAVRLHKELEDAHDETRFLTEKLGQARGERDAIAQQSEEHRRQLDRAQASLTEAQELLRQYVDKDRSLVQELLDERGTGAPS